MLIGAGVERRTDGNLVLENIPATPPALAAQLRAWDNFRTARFEDWLADGTMLIATRFSATSQLHRVRNPDGARTQITFFDEPVAQALARPYHPRAFALRRDAGGGEAYQIDLATLDGADTTITAPGTRNQAMVFSPDGSVLAWSSVPPGKHDYAIWLADPDRPRSANPVLQGEGEIDPLAFSPDGKTLLFERRDVLNVSQKLFLLTLTSGTVTPLHPSAAQIDYDLPIGAPQFTPDGAAIILGSNEAEEFRRLVRLELASGQITPLTEKASGDLEGLSLSPDGAQLAYSLNDDGISRLFLRDMKSGETRPIDGLPGGCLGAMRFSPDGRRLAINLSSATTPLDIWTYAPDTRRLERWTHSETGGIDATALVAPTLVHIASFDGREIPVWRFDPRTPDTGKRPVIISIHGGPEGETRPSFWPPYQLWLQRLGAVILAPNIRGSDGYGRTYLSLDNGMHRADAVRDIGALIDWAGRQPDLDAKRIVVTGGSYGGFMTLSAFAAYGDKLAGAYDIVGISNVVTYLEHTEAYRRDLRRTEYGDERRPAMRAWLEKTAPINNTAKMTKPLFVVAGRNDPKIPYTESEQLVAKLRAQGGDVWYMLASDEGHGYRRKANLDAQRAAEVLWFQKVFGLDGGK